jgi:hypothetical protein
MTDFMRVFARACLCLGLASCATNEGGYTTSNAVEARLLGMTELEVVTQPGAPTEQVSLSGGIKAWTYRTGGDDYDLTSGKCTVSMTLQSGKVVTAKVFSKDRSWISFPMGACSPIIGRLS